MWSTIHSSKEPCSPHIFLANIHSSISHHFIYVYFRLPLSVAIPSVSRLYCGTTSYNSPSSPWSPLRIKNYGQTLLEPPRWPSKLPLNKIENMCIHFTSYLVQNDCVSIMDWCRCWKRRWMDVTDIVIVHSCYHALIVLFNWISNFRRHQVKLRTKLIISIIWNKLLFHLIGHMEINCCDDYSMLIKMGESPCRISDFNQAFFGFMKRCLAILIGWSKASCLNFNAYTKRRMTGIKHYFLRIEGKINK